MDRRGSPSRSPRHVADERVGQPWAGSETGPPPRGARSSPELLRGHGAHQYLARASGKPTDGAQRIDRSSPLASR